MAQSKKLMQLTRRGAAILFAGVIFLECSPACASIGGIYDLPDGHSFIVSPFDPDPDTHLWTYLEPDTGRFAILRESENGEWIGEATVGPSGGLPAVTLKSTQSGLTRTQVGGAAVPVKPRALNVESYSFTADGATLKGTLLLPPSAEPHPALVALHGSGPLTRWAAGPFEYYFVYLGYAVLAFDKRGSGESSTAPKASNLLALADDGVAAMKSLATRADIRANRIGIWGPSQGGFLSLVAASRTRGFAFAIDQSGVLVPAWQQNIYQSGAEARAEGLPDQDAQAARAYTARLMNVARSGKGWPEFRTEIARAATTSWAKFVYRPESLQELRGLWKSDFSADPRPYLHNIHIPVLGLFGSKDISTPVPETTDALRDHIRPLSNLTVMLVDGADHPLFEAKTGSFSEIATLSHLSPKALGALKDFLARMAQ